MDQVQSLEELMAEQQSVGTVDIPGRTVRTFGQSTLSTTLTVSKLLQIYDVDFEVQRGIIPQNLSKLMDYIMLYVENEQPIFFPGVILSARGAGEFDPVRNVYRLQPVEKLYVVDGQHRLAAFKRLAETLQGLMARARDRREYERMGDITEKLKRLYNFPLSTMIYLDIDARQERQLFSDINKLPRKIGGNLALLRDQRRFYHVLATSLAEKDPTLRALGVDTFSERGKGEEYLFSYHLLIEVLTGLFEGRLRTAARGNRYTFTEEEHDAHFADAADYFNRLRSFLPEPNRAELCWSETVQVALALFFHEEAVKTGEFNKYSLAYAMRILPHIPWNAIFNGDEKDRLPRRTRIMKAYQFVKTFFNEKHLFVITEREDVG